MGPLFRRLLIWVAPLALGYFLKKFQNKNQSTTPRPR